KLLTLRKCICICRFAQRFRCRRLRSPDLDHVRHKLRVGWATVETNFIEFISKVAAPAELLRQEETRRNVYAIAVGISKLTEPAVGTFAERVGPIRKTN